MFRPLPLSPLTIPASASQNDFYSDFYRKGHLVKISSSSVKFSHQSQYSLVDNSLKFCDNKGVEMPAVIKNPDSSLNHPFPLPISLSISPYIKETSGLWIQQRTKDFAFGVQCYFKHCTDYRPFPILQVASRRCLT